MSVVLNDKPRQSTLKWRWPLSRQLTLSVATLAVLLAVWWAVAALQLISPLFLPPPGQVLWLVILPGALPEILTGLRIGLGVGWSTLVAAELIAATRGLGFMVQSAGEFLATDVVLAGIAVIAIIAFLLELGLRALQRRLTPWHGEVQ
ncbi:ABC transporter permease subunit [Klebsiella pneumoniae]|uniref:ABC transporter permease subunit n=1 Tax=Klebsiella pneumoniae TaxID=573 RepID=UPI000E2BB1D8|nr:ABC transporter permease subunit [Klebsiella pneumoniae]SVQ97492.1 Taurine transport system permease TauC [Klebsiella pneumoniae]